MRRDARIDALPALRRGAVAIDDKRHASVAGSIRVPAFARSTGDGVDGLADGIVAFINRAFAARAGLCSLRMDFVRRLNAARYPLAKGFRLRLLCSRQACYLAEAARA